MTALASLLDALAAGRVRSVDLTQPLSERTPILQLPPLTPVPLMMFVTPWISFLLNRHWVFRAA